MTDKQPERRRGRPLLILILIIALLPLGGVLWMVANRHLPYEAELNAAFARVRPAADKGGYKVFEAVK